MAKTKKKNGKKKIAAAGKSAGRTAKTRRGGRQGASGLAFGRGANPARVQAILQGLDAAYPEASCALVHRNPFELLIATILSAQCTDVTVNIVTKDLFPKYPDARAGAGNSPDGIFPQQDEVHHGREQEDCRGIRRESAANDGRVADIAGSGAQDGERSAGIGFRDCGRSRGGYARAAALGAIGPDEEYRPEKDRAGFDADYSTGEVDFIFAPVDLARAAGVQCAQAEVCRMQLGEAVLFKR
jgi:hypothetical protein